jgi:predicted 2-oxoglutarate/Fe(II)-dependent dioxygenase YbiX
MPVKRQKNIHDEYWHDHIDTEQYGTFAYTTLLYLNSQQQDFEGGSFTFLPTKKGRGEPVTVEPREGRLVIFSSGAENTHRVTRVGKGVRIALTTAFTCNKEVADAIGPFPWPEESAEEVTEGSTD